jgi:hypothetical protein
MLALLGGLGATARWTGPNAVEVATSGSKVDII